MRLPFLLPAALALALALGFGLPPQDLRAPTDPVDQAAGSSSAQKALTFGAL